MPEICRFYGIIIRMYFEDHSPPHFHAFYGSQEALIEISSSAVLAGNLQPRALGLVAEWTSLHRTDLEEAWLRAKHLENPGKIAPLD